MSRPVPRFPAHRLLFGCRRFAQYHNRLHNILSTWANALYITPAIAGGFVYGGSFTDHKVFCLNATTGTRLWSYAASAEVRSSPAVAGGRVFFGCDDHKVYCVNALSGAFLWSFTTGNQVTSSPAISGDFVYIGSGDGNFYCLNASTGQKIWSYNLGAWIQSSPAIANGHVVISTNGNVVCSLPIILGAPPSAPQDVQAYSEDGKVILWWQPPASTGGLPILHYKVFNGTAAGNVDCFHVHGHFGHLG